MAGKDKTTSNEQQQAVSQNTIDPQELSMLQGNYAGAQGRANSLTPYTGQMVAGFSPTQMQAQGVLSGIGTDPQYAAANNNAIGSVQGVLGNPVNGNITSQNVTPSQINAQGILAPSQVYAPQVRAPQIGAPSQVSNTPVSSSPVTAGMLAGTDISPYENPYTKDVINASVAQNEQARKIAQVSDAQQATAQGAFGGSRSGVAAGVTNGQYDLNDQNFIANQNANNFTQAQAAATGDINRKYGADTYNATNALDASKFNSSNDLAAGEFNSTAGTNAANINAGLLANAQATNQAARINTGEFNSTAGTNAAQFNSNQGILAQQANQTAGINTGEFNATNNQSAQQQSVNNALASAGLTLNAAGQIVSLNNQNLGTAAAQAGILGSVGDAQQAQQQAELSAAYEAYSQGQQLTLAQQQLLNSALGLIPNQQTVTSSGTSSGTSSTTKTPGLTDIINSIGSLTKGLGSMGVGA